MFTMSDKDTPAIEHIVQVLRKLRKFYKMIGAVARFDEFGGVLVKCKAKCRTCGRRINFGNENTYRLALHYRARAHNRGDEKAIRSFLIPKVKKLVVEGLTSSSSDTSSSDEEDYTMSPIGHVPFPPVSPINSTNSAIPTKSNMTPSELEFSEYSEWSPRLRQTNFMTSTQASNWDDEDM